MDLADLVGLPRVVEDALGGSRLPGIDVGHDADVAIPVERSLTCHGVVSKSAAGATTVRGPPALQSSEKAGRPTRRTPHSGVSGGIAPRASGRLALDEGPRRTPRVVSWRTRGGAAKRRHISPMFAPKKPDPSKSTRRGSDVNPRTELHLCGDRQAARPTHQR